MRPERVAIVSVMSFNCVGRTIARAVAVLLFVGASDLANAGDHPVNSEADLRSALTTAVDGDTITFNVDVTLTQDLPAVQASVTLVGNDRILDGANAYRGLFVAKFTGVFGTPAAVNVAIQDLTIQNARARGGAGQDNAGAGAGLGAALFVADLATVTASNLKFNANSAKGGLGGASGIYGGGGGGGLGGLGGGSRGAGGGGVGASATGGNGGVGADGASGIIGGLASGGDGAGSGFGAGGSNGGGGGGGGASSGSTTAGGGGGGVAGGTAANGGSGGNGGFGGGGGGGGDAGGDGGSGGFGGGGGAIGFAGGSLTGVGGFGGGGAGGAAGGFGGGNGGVSVAGFPGGGGGAGMGGAVFVQQGGSLTLAGPLAISGNSVSGGLAQDASASAGSAYGSGIFLQGDGGPLTFAPGIGETQTVADDIADQSGSGGTGSRGLSKSGAGTLILSGSNSYSGATTVDAGTLIVDGPGTTALTVKSGGTLGGIGPIASPVTVNSGGTIAPGDSPGTLNLADLTLDGGSALAFQLGATAAPGDSDLVALSGALSKGAAGTVTFHFSDGIGAPALNTTYTLITFTQPTDFLVSDFGYDYAGANPSLVGTFSFGGSGNALSLQFTAITTPVRLQAFEVQ